MAKSKGKSRLCCCSWLKFEDVKEFALEEIEILRNVIVSVFDFQKYMFRDFKDVWVVMYWWHKHKFIL